MPSDQIQSTVRNKETDSRIENLLVSNTFGVQEKNEQKEEDAPKIAII